MENGLTNDEINVIREFITDFDNVKEILNKHLNEIQSVIENKGEEKDSTIVMKECKTCGRWNDKERVTCIRCNSRI